MKKRNVKRILAVMLAASMMAGTLAGCGNTAENTGADKETGSASVAESSDTADTSAAEESSEPVEEEPVVIHMVAAKDAASFDWNEYYWCELLEEELNVDLQIETIAKDVWEEKISLYFASNNVPDLIVYDIDAATYGAQGFLLDMNDYISEELTPNIYRNLQEVPALRAVSQELDGSMYKLYGYDSDPLNLSRHLNYVNYKWCEQAIGKPQPETLDEYTEYLKYVRDNDMNGNGDATDEIPLTGRYAEHRSINIMTGILSAFGHVTTGNQMEVADDGTTAVFLPATDDYKEFLKYMNMLWEENLLDHEFFTQDGSLKSSKFASGVVGAYGSWSNPDKENFRMLAPMTSEINDTKVAAVNVIKQVSVIHASADTENPEKVMQVIDWFMDREHDLILKGTIMYGEDPQWPEYGYKWEFDAEKGYETWVWYGPDGVNDYPDEYTSVSDFKYHEITCSYEHIPLFSDYLNTSYLQEDGDNNYETATYVLPNAKAIFPNVKRTEEENEDYALIWTDLNSYYQEMETKMITGELDIDATWDEFIQGLKDRGVDRYVEIYQNGLDAYLAN